MTLVMNGTGHAPFAKPVRFLFALYSLATAHIVEVGVYALGFSVGELMGIGGFEQENVDTFVDASAVVCDDADTVSAYHLERDQSYSYFSFRLALNFFFQNGMQIRSQTLK